MPKILIVDDNAAEVREPLKRQLGRIYGKEQILEAMDGQMAIDMVARHRPEVIILDVMMPVMNGIDACRAIRAEEKNHGIYIIMLTGRDGGLPEGLQVGANVYLRKPCSIEELLAVVEKGMAEVAEYKANLDKQHALEDQVGNLNESRWAFQDIITSLSTGLLLCAPTPLGRIRYMNPSAVRLTDHPAQELREIPVGHLFVETDISQLLEDLLANARLWDVPKTLRTGAGKTIPVLLAGRVICDSKGQEKWIMLEMRALD
ncbi:MAG: response regulator [Magnetococcales bacterium]|nr:response regulator [Magnetococcales bacterium]